MNSVPLSLTIIFGLPRSPIVARPVHISDSFMAGMGSYGADCTAEKGDETCVALPRLSRHEGAHQVGHLGGGQILVQRADEQSIQRLHHQYVRI